MEKNDDFQSNIRFSSIGIVAADKPLNTKFIEVYPFELLPFHEGKISDDIVDIARTGETTTGETYTVNLKKSMSVKAEWMGETNRVTSPNVKKNEQVKLWTTGNGEKWWWESYGRDDRLRDRERVTWAWAARSGPGELNADNSYYLDIDTIEQRITLSTSKVNGEVCKYIAQFNTKEGNFTVQDDLGNVIQLDSSKTKITFKNAVDTYFTLDKKNIILNAVEDFIGVVGRNFSLKVGGDYTTTITGNVNETVGGNKNTDTTGDVTNVVKGKMTETVTGDYTLSAASYAATVQSTFTVNGQAVSLNGSASVNLAAPTIGIAGILSVSGPGGAPGTATMLGDVALTGNMGITGNFLLTGNGVCTGSFQCLDIITPTWNGIPQADHLIDT